MKRILLVEEHNRTPLVFDVSNQLSMMKACQHLLRLLVENHHLDVGPEPEVVEWQVPDGAPGWFVKIVHSEVRKKKLEWQEWHERVQLLKHANDAIAAHQPPYAPNIFEVLHQASSGVFIVSVIHAQEI